MAPSNVLKGLPNGFFWDKQNKKSLSINERAINILYNALQMMSFIEYLFTEMQRIFDVFMRSHTKALTMLNNLNLFY